MFKFILSAVRTSCETYNLEMLGVLDQNSVPPDDQVINAYEDILLTTMNNVSSVAQQVCISLIFNHMHKLGCRM